MIDSNSNNNNNGVDVTMIFVNLQRVEIDKKLKQGTHFSFRKNEWQIHDVFFLLWDILDTLKCSWSPK